MDKNIYDDILDDIKYERKNSKKIRNSLRKKGKMKSNELFDYSISSLEENGRIYRNENDEFCISPPSFFVSSLFSTKKGNKYVQKDGENRIPIDDNNLNGALDYDRVLVDDSNGKAVVVSILKRFNPQIVCEVVLSEDGVKTLKPYKVHGDLKVRISSNDMDKLVDGERILINIGTVKNYDVFDCDFIKSIGHKNEPGSEIMAIAYSKGFDLEFSELARKQLEMIPSHVIRRDTRDKERIDLRGEIIFTIDGVDTKDIDDAVSCKKLPNGNYELGVHIADLSNYIKIDSPLFKEAYKRGTSVYMLDSVLPMFPPYISNGICSLNPCVDRLTKSCIMEINSNGEVVDYKICKSIIRSRKKMNYDDVNKVLTGDIVPFGYEAFQKHLLLMYKLSLILNKRNEDRGILTFSSNEVKVRLGEDGKAEQFVERVSGPAENLIANFMILANETVATDMYWKNYPFIYRVHDTPNDIKLDDTVELIGSLGYRIKTCNNAYSPKEVQKVLKSLSSEEMFSVLSNLLLRSMRKAYYSINNIGHFGLALDNYTHFTSPIRRLPDFLVHFLIDTYNSKDLENVDFEHLESFLIDACQQASIKERQADDASFDASRLKMAEYMREHVGEEFEGSILMINATGVDVKTDNNICGKVKFNHVVNDKVKYDEDRCQLIGKSERYKIGHRVLLKVLDVSFETFDVYFSIEKDLTNSKGKVKVLTK